MFQDLFKKSQAWKQRGGREFKDLQSQKHLLADPFQKFAILHSAESRSDYSWTWLMMVKQ